MKSSKNNLKQLANCHAILPNDRNNSRNLPDINQTYNSGAGLCNQLYNIVNGIIECQQANISWCVIDSFFTCIYQKRLCEISQIIDLKRTSENINRIPDFEEIKLLDRMNCEFKLLKAEYGLKAVNVIDITDQCQRFIDANGFRIPSDLKLNKISGDPCHGLTKKLYLQIKLGDHLLEIVENENNHQVVIDLNYIKNGCFQSKKYSMYQAYKYNEHLFNQIYECLVYNPVFDDMIASAVTEHKITDSFVVHLRVESDMIEHIKYLSHLHYQHNFTTEEIRKFVFDTYTEVINKYISPDQKLHILTYEPEKIKQIIDQKYAITYIDNDYKMRILRDHLGMDGRELCALLDLLIGLKYGTGFMGLYSTDKKTVNSTFSYILAKTIKQNLFMISLNINKLIYEVIRS